MTKTEQQSYQKVKEQADRFNFHLYRIETGRTAPGIPDVWFRMAKFNTSGWVEMKRSNCNVHDPKTGEPHDWKWVHDHIKFRPLQETFIQHCYNDKILALVIVEFNDGWIVFDGSAYTDDHRFMFCYEVKWLWPMLLNQYVRPWVPELLPDWKGPAAAAETPADDGISGSVSDEAFPELAGASGSLREFCKLQLS